MLDSSWIQIKPVKWKTGLLTVPNIWSFCFPLRIPQWIITTGPKQVAQQGVCSFHANMSISLGREKNLFILLTIHCVGVCMHVWNGKVSCKYVNISRISYILCSGRVNCVTSCLQYYGAMVLIVPIYIM